MYQTGGKTGRVKATLGIVAALAMAASLLSAPSAFAADEPLPEDVAINATNFPDANLRAAVAANDSDKDGVLSGSEARYAFLKLTDDNGNGIVKDFTGIGLLPTLEYLNIGKGSVTKLDLSKNVGLTNLTISENKLASLDLSKNVNLETVYANGNALTSVTLPKTGTLEIVDVSENQLASLDLSGDPSLTTIRAYKNKLASVRFGATDKLQEVSLYENQLASLDLSGASKLKTLDVSENALATLKLPASAPELTGISAAQNKLTSLDASAYAKLENLYVYENQLASLKLPKTTTLENVAASNNKLTAIDVAGRTGLTSLRLGHNQLKTVDAGNLPKLETLDVSYNELTKLPNVSGSPNLKYVYTDHNKLDSVVVAFNTNGGTAVDKQYVEKGKTATKPADPTRTGYTFLGWSRYSGLADATKYGYFDFTRGTVSYDTTLYAQWWDGKGDKPAVRFENDIKPITFADVDAKTPHRSDIVWLAAEGVSTGWKKADGTYEFRGAQPVVRQDMAAFLYRLAGSPAFDETKAKNPFTDVDAKTPHYKEVLWLASSGISTGWKDGTFRGMETVKRQDMAAFLKRLADLEKANPKLGKDVSFTDVNDATPHVDEIRWLARTGVTTGWKDGTFRGMNPVVRQDMAAFLHRMDANVL